MADTSNQINVVVVEDDQVFRESIQDLINDSQPLNCEHACESCEEAIELLSNDYAPEVILLDIDLPGMSGIEGIQHFQKLSPASRIIILTVFDDDKKIFRAVCQRASGYLLKSANSAAICKYVHDVMDGGAAMSPTIAAKVLKMFTQFSEPQEQDYGLTERETEILHLLVNGLSKKHIAGQLMISLHTVDTHLKNIYAKLHVHSQVDVVAKALRERLI